MKINDNGVIRDMTPEEIKADKETDEFLAEISSEKDDRAIMEEFIERLSEADTASEIIEIAKDIKGKLV